MPITPTPKDTVLTDGTAKLYRFRRANGAAAAKGLPLLLVPSLINRWYVLDLRSGASVASALVDAGLDVFCLDWGVPNDEDRYLSWDDVVARLSRMVRRVKRETGANQIGLLGYCIGGTLTAIHTALEPDSIAALVNLAGPIDFSEGGFLAHMTNPRWFDPEAIASAGNMRAEQMQAGFVALRPTSQLSKWVSFFDRLTDPERLEAFQALEEWASANIAFPAEAYVKYIRELYQQNALICGEHAIGARRVDLAKIRCPLLTVVTDRDTICPPKAAQALGTHSSSEDQQLLVIPGGHVGAVVGGRAPKELYPKLASWLLDKLGKDS
ncbi:MAG: alpha/beta fold hydrolase [Polyangiaceae bacterium]|nr:alpha/beta fold hydrolase [Polyangiaceae bacterium]